MAGAPWLLLGTFFGLLFLRVPIAVALGASSFLTIWWYNLGVPVISYNFWAGIAKFPLLAIPFFILAGVLMEKAGMAERIVRFIRVLVGHWPGGLGLVAVVVGIFWGAVSGSGPATVAALGTVLIPGMARLGYDRKFATAVISATSELSIVIPPSIALIIYATLANQSVRTMFMAGVVPGLVVGAILAALTVFLSVQRGYGGEPRASQSEVLAALRDAVWALLAPVIILGGIYGGIFTPTESAAVAEIGRA